MSTFPWRPKSAEMRFGGHANLCQLLSYAQKRVSPHEDEREGSTPKQLIRCVNIEGSSPRTSFVTCGTSECGYKYLALSLKESHSDGRTTPLNYDWNRDTPLKMDMTDYFLTALTETVMVDVFQHLLLAHLQNFVAYFPDAIDPSAQTHRAGQFCLRQNIMDGGQNQILTARALEEIGLEQVSFPTACPANVGGGTYECDPTLQCLCDALAHRRHAGYPLRRITILDSLNAETNKAVDELRGLFARRNGMGSATSTQTPSLLYDGA